MIVRSAARCYIREPKPTTPLRDISRDIVVVTFFYRTIYNGYSVINLQKPAQHEIFSSPAHDVCAASFTVSFNSHEPDLLCMR